MYIFLIIWGRSWLSLEETVSSASDDDDDPERPIFSTITGKYRQAKRYGGKSRTENVVHFAQCSEQIKQAATMKAQIHLLSSFEIKKTRLQGFQIVLQVKPSILKLSSFSLYPRFPFRSILARALIPRFGRQSRAGCTRSLGTRRRSGIPRGYKDDHT